MISILDDDDIKAMALDEQASGGPVEDEVTEADLLDLLEQLSQGHPPSEEEQI